MILPESALFCIQELEQAGFEAYAVGGCVRDSLLGLTPHDYDLCTSATPQQTAAVFADFTLVRSGEKHGTVGVVIDGQVLEITTFRTEGGYADGRHPDWVRFVSSVEEDLSRRDFTVNAMAYNPTRGYVDPFGGQKDLQAKCLRAVGDPALRFTEDSLRILRGVRFAVRYGLTPEIATLSAMKQLAPLMDNLARERVFEELCKLLPLVNAEDLLTYQTILTQVLPPLAPCVNFDQRNAHHRYDVFTHTARVVAGLPADLTLRWAALLHDCGKPAAFSLDDRGSGHFYGHSKESARLANDLLLHLKAPNALREQVVFLIEHHMLPPEADKKLLRRRMSKYGVEAMQKLTALQYADCVGTGVPHDTDVFRQITRLMDQILQEDACLHISDLCIDGNDLIALGFAPGPQLGQCLSHLLEQVQDEAIPNKKEALLSAAKDFLKQ